MVKVYYDQDADLNLLKGKKIAILGYGSQGHAQAQNLRDSGMDVIIGLPVEEIPSRQQAEADGFTILLPGEAAAQADFIQILAPDEIQAKLYRGRHRF